MIMHSGAVVHHMKPYSQLKAANVDGTLSILRLASESESNAAVHFISSLSAIPKDFYGGPQRAGEGEGGKVTEDISLEDSLSAGQGRQSQAHALMPYLQTKLVSEVIVPFSTHLRLYLCLSLFISTFLY